jgi:flagellar FliJ protein
MFHFRLQPVLDYRKLSEEKLMLECMDAERRLGDEREALKKLDTELVDLISELKEKRNGKLSATDVSFYLSYINSIKNKESRQKEIVCKVEEDLKERKTELADAAGKRKVLEKIRERKFKEYELSVDDKERKMLDETAILRSVRGMKSEETDSFV